MNLIQKISTPIQYVKTVGPQRASMLQKLGIYTVRDMLYYFPRRYEERKLIEFVNECSQDDTVSVRGTVLGSQDLKLRQGLTATKVALSDGMNIFYAVWFNQPHIKKQIAPGLTITVTGKVDQRYGAVQIRVADFELNNSSVAENYWCSIVPVYALSEKINQKFLRGLIKTCLEEYTSEQEEFIPENLIKKYRLLPLNRSLLWMHQPQNILETEKARRRLIFEELFLLQLLLAARKRTITRKLKFFTYSDKNEILKKFLNNLSFGLTPAQSRVWQEIMTDMHRSVPMYRLLQGDVGSGKTVISTLALLKAAENGLQGALMVPTEILAEQHYLFLKRYMEPLGINVGLLTGKMKKAEKNMAFQLIESGQMQIVIGTHALIQENIAFKHLAMAVIDEQHRFGVRQRATLQDKGICPDMLVMTATPIPRTLAMTLYGDLDISVIDQLPPGRKPIKTHVIYENKLPDTYEFMRKQIRIGRQAYIICPLVEESEHVESQAAIDLALELSEGELADFSVGLLHGRMKSELKEEVMTKFRLGEIDALVTTTVIEVGVDVPNATVMVILDADRFGLAQLHQLRGRVGRGLEQSYCILVANPKTDEARARLAAMHRSEDGFYLAEQDLRIRGPGEFCGTRQSGLPDLKVADLIRDWKILEVARQEAIDLLASDPELKKPENEALLREIRTRFPDSVQFAHIG
ncbi:ATP-dependent DNA helicase RecG [Desulfofarcimen acetoxidans DSM 771]|uniref:ATP-dependent DNA helicase RecG n=1 Tax=Desulfofarcimen acetoxidans (strain ATCC 49208 / DSM 771 / KCTC 5769 / VKM B-1644 / 5575) TaxID=485916 RepID=C8W567_DESAS|nr:ATP-dependent DNA helicase RecG [Desulfofarcimen acetoxidans]ACV62049.1 ATP-dependent DNA helicase RecG [Desulfofarcimen acetoxidans DSM 771]